MAVRARPRRCDEGGGILAADSSSERTCRRTPRGDTNAQAAQKREERPASRRGRRKKKRKKPSPIVTARQESLNVFRQVGRLATDSSDASSSTIEHRQPGFWSSWALRALELPSPTPPVPRLLVLSCMKPACQATGLQAITHTHTPTTWQRKQRESEGEGGRHTDTTVDPADRWPIWLGFVCTEPSPSCRHLPWVFASAFGCAHAAAKLSFFEPANLGDAEALGAQKAPLLSRPA